jgi:hypothetical protein
MTTATDITESVQDGVLKAVEVGQRLTIEAVSAAASTMDGFLPTKAMPSLGEGVIEPRQAVDSGFVFLERLLDAQKSFVTELMAIVMPPAPATSGPKKTAAAS